MFLSALSFLYNGCYYVLSTLYYFVSLLHIVLPFGLDVGLIGVAAYFMTKLKKAEEADVVNIFGNDPSSKDSDPEKTVRCIAHRGALLDAPENTIEAFKYCIEHGCNFIELDVRTSKDGQLIVIHDQGLERLTGTCSISDVQAVDWETLKNTDVGVKHPNREQFKEARLCLLDEALDYLLANKAKVIIDVKGQDSQIVDKIVKIYESRANLHQHAAVTCFNPYILYQIRKRDPRIVGAISYRPYVFSVSEFDAENGPTNPRFPENLPLQALLRCADILYSKVWRRAALWGGVSCVLLHKDMVCPIEVSYWRSVGVRCVGWSVNRPLEKLYWRGVLRASYLANTLVGEPDFSDVMMEDPDVKEIERAEALVNKILAREKSSR